MLRSRFVRHPRGDAGDRSVGLASLSETQKRYTEAENTYRRAIAFMEKRLGITHPDLIYALTSLADIYEKQAKYTGAEAMLRRAVEIAEKPLGIVGLMYPLTFLADRIAGRGRYGEVAALLTRVLERENQNSSHCCPAILLGA